jgi:hypothetical protein
MVLACFLMDEEDIAVPSGSLNNHFGVVYGGNVSRKLTTVRKLDTAIHTAKGHLTVPQTPRSLREVALLRYNDPAIENTRGGNNVEFG